MPDSSAGIESGALALDTLVSVLGKLGDDDRTMLSMFAAGEKPRVIADVFGKDGEHWMKSHLTRICGHRLSLGHLNFKDEAGLSATRAKLAEALPLLAQHEMQKRRAEEEQARQRKQTEEEQARREREEQLLTLASTITDLSDPDLKTLANLTAPVENTPTLQRVVSILGLTGVKLAEAVDLLLQAYDLAGRPQPKPAPEPDPPKPSALTRSTHGRTARPRLDWASVERRSRPGISKDIGFLADLVYGASERGKITRRGTPVEFGNLHTLVGHLCVAVLDPGHLIAKRS